MSERTPQADLKAFTSRILDARLETLRQRQPVPSRVYVSPFMAACLVQMINEQEPYAIWPTEWLTRNQIAAVYGLEWYEDRSLSGEAFRFETDAVDAGVQS